jgi:D-serine deaminase-like pyridoxal phosphate-dependent protein
MPVPRPLLSAGDPVSAIETPALIIDLDALDANIARMARYAEARRIRLRPHFKTHKCLEIARRQIAAGAVGLCCQKLSEAEILVSGGIRDVLVTNEVLAPVKLDRLMRLTDGAHIGVCVDSVAGVEALLACRPAASLIDVYIELDAGAGRCGVDDHANALDLARLVADQRHLRFAGIHAYHGRAQHLRTAGERAAAITQASRRVQALQDLLAYHDLRAPIVTGGGTGTFTLEATSGCYDEIQPGSYVFMDRDYADNDRDEAVPPFAHSLFILCMVQSRRSTHVVVDAGHKAHTIDSGMPVIAGHPGLIYQRPSDEHGVILASEGMSLPNLGEVLRLIPGHCDPTVNLYDWFICIQDGEVVDIWPVDARGAIT